MRSRQMHGVLWVLGTVQYCVALFGGGALWLILALATGFFGGNLLLQVAAGALLFALIGVEAWWAHLPPAGHPVGDIVVDLVSSAAIAGFGMGIVLAVVAVITRR